VVEPEIPGPVHVMEIGVVVDVILTVTKVLLQVIELVTADADKSGIPALAKTCTVDVALQPVLGSMAWSVYTPEAQAVVVKLFIGPHTPPSQLAVAPAGLVTLPDKVTDEDAQVIVWLAPAFTPVGVVVFWIAAIEVLYVQPFAGFKTYKV
jgi:hypothetical protein